MPILIIVFFPCVQNQKQPNVYQLKSINEQEVLYTSFQVIWKSQRPLPREPQTITIALSSLHLIDGKSLLLQTPHISVYQLNKSN